MRLVHSSSFSLALCLSCFALAGCATVFDNTQQRVTFEAKGANDVICNVGNVGMNYIVRPPQAILIQRGKQPLKAECRASGNRMVTVDIPTQLNSEGSYNAANLGLGAGYDYISGALFSYPDKVMIDFTNVPVRPNSAPDFAQDPNYDSEDMGPIRPELPGERALRERQKKAYEDYERALELEAERDRRMQEADPGTKK